MTANDYSISETCCLISTVSIFDISKKPDPDIDYFLSPLVLAIQLLAIIFQM